MMLRKVFLTYTIIAGFAEIRTFNLFAGLIRLVLLSVRVFHAQEAPLQEPDRDALSCRAADILCSTPCMGAR